MGGAGKSGNNRKNRHRYSAKKNESPQKQDFDRSKNQGHSHKRGENLLEGSKSKRGNILHERPVWTAPQAPSEPIPAYICPWCEKPIKDISTAISDKTSGRPVHFDCVLARLNQLEALENHDTICYLGGGRFGVVRSSSPADAGGFKIKKIFEWEDKDSHGEWRRNISEHFSVT